MSAFLKLRDTQGPLNSILFWKPTLQLKIILVHYLITPCEEMWVRHGRLICKHHTILVAAMGKSALWPEWHGVPGRGEHRGTQAVVNTDLHRGLQALCIFCLPCFLFFKTQKHNSCGKINHIVKNNAISHKPIFVGALWNFKTSEAVTICMNLANGEWPDLKVSFSSDTQYLAFLLGDQFSKLESCILHKPIINKPVLTDYL